MLDTSSGYPQVVKSAYEVKKVSFDFRGELQGNTMASAVSVTAANQNRISGSSSPTIGTPSYTATTVDVVLSSGTDGEDYLMEARGTDSGSQSLSTKIMLSVRGGS